MANDDNDDLKAFEQHEDRKWANLQRIQQRMKDRESKRKPPRQTEFKKKKKLKNIENPEWKAKFEADRLEKERLIAEKYKEDMKRKKQIEAQKKAKQEAILKRKWEEEQKKRPKLPDTKKWASNYAKQQYEMQRKIDEQYELKKQQDNEQRSEFKKKAAAIEKKYDDAKPKKKPRDPNKKPIVIDAENNAWTAVERNDFDLLDRIYTFFPADIKKKDKQGNTILHHAIRHHDEQSNNNAALIEFLIPKLPPSYMNAVNYLGNPPMNLAVYEKKMECMRAMYSCKDRKRRPDLDHMNINGRTVLMWAAMRDEVEILEFLLGCDPPPSIDLFAEKHHKTALTYAVEHNKHNAVRVLVEHGANFYIKNKLGKSARDMAQSKSLFAIMRQERIVVVKGCVQSTLIKRLDFPDYLIAIIAAFVAEIPPEILEQERKEKEEEEKAKKKKKKGGNRRQIGRGRGPARRGRGRGRGDAGQ